MKRIKNGNNTYIKFEEGDDLDFIARTISMFLYVDKDGNYICEEYDTKRAVLYDHLKKKWEPIPFESYDRDQLTQIMDEDKDNLLKVIPPFEVLDSIRNQQSNETGLYWAKKRQETKRKVIGWVYASDYKDYQQANDDDDSYAAALINDIVEHQYYFAGDMMEYMPLFDDGKYVNYSSRGWGYIISISREEYDEMDYSTYAFSGWLPDLEKRKYPEIGPYQKEIRKIEVSDKLYKVLRDDYNNFYDKYISEFDSSLLMIYEFRELTDILFKGYHDHIIFVNKDTNESFECNFLGFIKTFEDNFDLKEFIDDYICDRSDDHKVLYIGQFKEIKKKLKDDIPVKVLISFTD